MFEVINTCAHTGAERLADYVNATADTTHGARLNIMDWTWRVALDIIGRVAFDHDFGCGESKNARTIYQSWVDQVNAGFDRMGAIVGLDDSWQLRGACLLTCIYGKAPLVLRAFPFIARLPLKAIEAQEDVKRRLQSIGQAMLEHNMHETKNNNLLSSIGSYSYQCTSFHYVNSSVSSSSLGSD